MTARQAFEVTVGGRGLAVRGLTDGKSALYVIRVRDHDLGAPPGDASYPLPALGFLEFEDNVVTGVLKRAFLDRDSARELVAAIAERHVGDVQTVNTVDLVVSELRLIDSGEESLCFTVAGDEHAGFFRR